MKILRNITYKNLLSEIEELKELNARLIKAIAEDDQEELYIVKSTVRLKERLDDTYWHGNTQYV